MILLKILDELIEQSKRVTKLSNEQLAVQLEKLEADNFPDQLRINQAASYIKYGKPCNALATWCGMAAESQTNDNCILLLEAMQRLSEDD